ncbi:Hemolysin/related protein [Rubellimicrobium thermophilum DSM 16684]|uniref:Hemolysin/related protein n=1 Tax=Rubellimicrobium thermophilum DSM 16684 TaxID=1123069 RepID=S9R1F5_9RHOB|nr:hemolysin family protein [Rubellimicrobium thermophilum]EPX87496.1 Hemolysin/related protein [Rubellimicrobium thermophilum DSM 16684]
MSDASSSSAARPSGEERDAPPEGPSHPTGRGGFLSRIIEALNRPEEEPVRPAAGTAPPAPSLSNLRRMRVEDVAIPKAEIVAVPVTIALPDLIRVFRESGRTRVPVYEGSLDSPLGMVNLKDVALRHGFGATGEFVLRDMLRPLLYVPPSMPLATLLQKMQSERIHMALVIDEYGGTDGLCTIEDLLETVVGEIMDEHDREEDKPDFWPEGEGVWIAEGHAPIIAFEREIGLDLTAHEDIDAEEVDTLGGLVFYLAGHVPLPGETIRHPDGLLFEVLEADSRRIRRLRVRMEPAPASMPEPAPRPAR